jgi:hypothetical protein
MRRLDAVFGATSLVEAGLERIQLLQSCHPFGMVTGYQSNRCPLKGNRSTYTTKPPNIALQPTG